MTHGRALFVAVVLASVAVEGACPAGSPAEPISTKPTSPKVLAALAKPATFDFVETPLSDVIAFIRDFTGVNVLLDLNGLELANVDPGQPITLRLDNIELSAALDLLLAPHELTYVVRGEVVLLTDVEQTAHEPETRVYPVVDLIEIGAGPGKSAWLDEEYIELIQDTLDPDAWDAGGGQFSIRFAPATASFVVSAGQPMHRKLEDLLTQLRASKKQNDALADESGLPPLAQRQAQMASEIRERREARRESRRKPTLQERREMAEMEEGEARAELAKVELEKAKLELERLKEGKSGGGDGEKGGGGEK